MLGFNPGFKANSKDLFLSLSSFLNSNVLLYEHITGAISAKVPLSDNPLASFLNAKIENVSVRIDRVFQDFFEEVFAIFGEEIDPVFSDDEEEGPPKMSELSVLGVTPLIPENLEQVKLAFD